MKKIMLLIITVFLALNFTGCVSQETKKGTVSENVRVEDICDTTVSIDDIKFYELEDSQSYWNVFTHSVARGEYGYYYATFGGNGSTFLGYVDDENYECIPLCNKAQCAHNDENCDAVFKGYMQSVWYYKDFLYLIKYNNEGKAVLVQVKPDGTERKELFEIGNIPVDSSNTYNLAFCNDCVYIYDRTGNCRLSEPMQINIRKISLDKKTDENIITSDESNVIFDAVKSYGGNIFFIYSNTEYNRETGQNVTTSDGLYYYSGDKIGKIIDKNISDYSIDVDNKIIYYYVINEGLYKYELQSKNEELIYKSERNSSLCQVSFDGEYLYLDNRRWCSFAMTSEFVPELWVLDTEGDIINVLHTGEANNTFFGDKDNILFEVYGRSEISGRSIHKIAYIKKIEIENAESWSEAEWQMQ